jgi:UDP-glucose 4-epimerase
MTWLLTGGAGYIGAHVLRALRGAGEEVVVLDDLSTGLPERVPADVPLVVASVLDRRAVQAAMREHQVTGVVHLAGKKAVEESMRLPLHYYRENIEGVLSLLEAMKAEEVHRLVFSSSAAVYGTPTTPTVTEDSPTSAQSPYGRSKLIGEWMVRDAAAAAGVGAASLRYFNVVGCAQPALVDTGGTNLFPRVIEALHRGERPMVFGTDYPTPDGTCVRDYIHVSDLADAHVAAARMTRLSGCQVINVGRGQGFTVLEVLRAFGAVAGREVSPVLGPRRAGDPASMVAEVTKAASLLGWRARLGLEEMVASAWEGAGVQAGVPTGMTGTG